jgi:hypothetical protein
MFALFGARSAAVRSAPSKFHERWPSFAAAVTLLALGGMVSGCATPTSLTGSDPADPRAKVDAVTYRSTVAPYHRLRPTAPSLWRQRNDSAAPSSNSEH